MPRKQKILLFLIIFITVIAVTAIIIFKQFNINCKKTFECNAQSKSTVGIITTQTGEIEIPANSGIVKIIGSALAGDAAPIDGAIITTSGTDSFTFSHVFAIDPATKGGEVEITFDEPVCIGDEDVSFIMLAIRENGDPIAFYMTLTVIYVPDCC